eukprot:CAMPEP_0179115828 /NCGR_PEP_ID=MMETSP0796-20121207/54297_1 /TAXON_ID=73915 /ORGANISM="Pyrodinium bahamense, Strain pbaha01" /LENGTH=48 /DNA_ID= /DNA_START= /DNA_END= /DNA_ORIENTATION=
MESVVAPEAIADDLLLVHGGLCEVAHLYKQRAAEPTKLQSQSSARDPQ